ncbi:MAG TPA: inositol monophosphatase family protein [Candidatus Dormibacteraeota bacterium]|nr:inositol monophosphatase family protein [Candidatus Dormibacteraeota bacterium]
MTDQEWVRALRSIAAGVAEEVTPLLGTEQGRQILGRGAGGDRTVELDRRAEEVALQGLRALGEPCTVLSEETGRIDLGAPYPLIFIDPVDGSLNAKRGVPVAAVMMSLLDGPTLGDVRVGVIHELFGGRSWHAVRGGGLFRDGERIAPQPAGPNPMEILVMEVRPAYLEAAMPLILQFSRMRLLGSIAISLLQVASGAADVFCSAMAGRAFDMTAALVMIREAGGVLTDFEGGDLLHLRAGLEQRATLLCAGDEDRHRRALQVLREARG